MEQEATPSKVVETKVPRGAAFIEIVEESETFPWHYTDADGITYTDTKFTLRILPETLDKQWRRELTKKERDRGNVREVLNWDVYSQRALRHCVVDIDGLRKKGQPIAFRPDEHLRLLPERVKAAIIRLCVGKEAGLENAATVTQEDAEDPNA